ncbi:MAG: peptide deformylase [Candidatus Paceibacterota bacterium]|jgi:peptide deformylase
MVTIVQKDDPVLRQEARRVPEGMFGTPALRKILKDMSAALASQDDGVAIAAPQIGVSLRIFVVSGSVMEMLYPEQSRGTGKPKKAKDIVFINPEILRLSKDREELEEGCLSVRYLYGKISRAKKARIAARDEKGRAFELSGSGLLAQIFQHETDHLDGTLFIDNATDLHDVPPEEARRNLRRDLQNEDE